MMKTRREKMKRLLLLLLALPILMIGCKEKQSKKSADLVYVNWAEGVAYTHLIQNLLENELGYEVSLIAADVAPAYASVAKGNNDAFMECWPGLHKDYLDKYGKNLVVLGDIYKGTICGLVVPSYVTIDNISQLKDNADKFDNTIVGIDAGAGVMNTTEQLIKDYDLGMTLLASSGPAMTTALKKAIANQEWIVVPGWKPHWMFGRWDLKILNQDKQKYWNEGAIQIMGRKTLPEDKPELAKFLGEFTITDTEISDLMVKINESDDIKTAVTQWVKDNPESIDRMLKNFR